MLQQELIKKICSENGVLVTSYSGLRQHQERLLAQRFDYVILDEGHKIRNPDAEITLACKQVTLPNHGTSEVKHFSQLSRKEFFHFTLEVVYGHTNGLRLSWLE